MPNELYELEQNVCEAVDEWIDHSGWPQYPSDMIQEIVEAWLPLYTYDLLTLARENLYLATAEPELGPAFDGSPTPINIIAANVYEYLWEKAWNHFNTLEEPEAT